MPTSSESDGPFVLMSASPQPLRALPEGMQLHQSVTKSHEKSHAYVKKKIVVEKHPAEKRKHKDYVTMKIKYKDGEWILKQQTQKIKI